METTSRTPRDPEDSLSIHSDGHAQILLTRSERLAAFGTWERDVVTGRGRWSPETFQLMGLHEDAGAPDFDVWLSWIHPEDRRPLHEAHALVATGGAIHAELTFRVTPPDGHMRVIRGSVFRAPDQPVVLGIAHDVTPETRAREDAEHTRALLAEAIDAVPEVITIRGNDGRPLWWNRAHEELTGLSREAINESRRGGSIHADDLAAFLAWTDAATDREPAAPGTETPTFRVVRPDGSIRHFRPMRGATIRLHGEAIGVVRSGRDVTEEVRARQEAAAHAAESAAILDGIPAAVALIDPAQRIVRCNRAFVDAAGCAVNEVIGEHVARFLVDAAPLAAAHGPAPGDARIVHLRRRDGSTTPVSLTAGPLRDTDPSGPRLLTFTDATATVLANEQVQALQRHEAIGELVAGVAHDFNNLLTGILGPLHMLQGNPLEQRWLDIAVEAAERAVPLTRQLLDASRPVPAELSPTDVTRVAADVVRLFSATSDRRLRFALHQPPLVPHVVATASGLQQVLINLVANARDAVLERLEADPEGPAGTVDVTIRVDDDAPPRVLVSVADNGRGVPEELRERIFDPFFTTKRSGKGTGVGLPTSRALVAQYGGTLTFHPHPGGGTVFTLELPVAGAALESGAASPSAPPRDRPLEGMRVLLIDDDDAVRAYAEHVLTVSGAIVDFAASAEIGLTLIAASPPEAAVFDLNMLDMSGWTFLRRARALAPGARLVVLSGHVDAEQQRRHRPDAVVWKPYRPAQLVQALLGTRSTGAAEAAGGAPA
ncbi:MAG: ATP-binding protein [Dehalococcoidia bacterium]